MSARRPPKSPGVSARRRFFDRCFIDRHEADAEEQDPVLGVPVKNWNVFRAFCRELGFDADHLRQLYAEDPRRMLVAPEMEAYVGVRAKRSGASQLIGRKRALAAKLLTAAPNNSIAARVRHHMQSHPAADFQVAPLTSALKLPKNKSRTVRLSLRKLHADGKVTRRARGVYRWKAK